MKIIELKTFNYKKSILMEIDQKLKKYSNFQKIILFSIVSICRCQLLDFETIKADIDNNK